ncbi:MAG: methylated-DNA--[protein]-cysteine S-methyltransferase [Microbacteriaceae bacterium]
MTTDSPPDSDLFFMRVMESPIGHLYLVSNGTAITFLSIGDPAETPDVVLTNPHALLDHAAGQLAEYFAGERREFDLPLEPRGTPFQQAVWSCLRETPWGEVTSYGAIAATTGRPAAGRAVGAAVAANPIALLVPCHRVLDADGRITGYSQGEGVPTKAWLLSHEGIAHRLPAGYIGPGSDHELQLAWGAWGAW